MGTGDHNDGGNLAMDKLPIHGGGAIFLVGSMKTTMTTTSMDLPYWFQA